jgi:glycosyltransferase involved in cell wall biosynthesis
VATIGHGVDTAVFRPLSRRERLEARRRLFGPQLAPEAAERLEHATIVLNANRNDRRKRMNLTFAEFAKFARGRRDVYLAVHSARRTPDADLDHLTRAVGLGGRVLFTHGSAGLPCVSDERLNEIYNCCDIGLNTSQCEGWGLVAFEHAATGAAQILSATDNLREIWGDNALLVGSEPTADCGSFAEALSLMSIPAVLDSLSRRAMAHARSPDLSWDKIVDEWMTLFRSTADFPPPVAHRALEASGASQAARAIRPGRTPFVASRSLSSL